MHPLRTTAQVHKTKITMDSYNQPDHLHDAASATDAPPINAARRNCLRTLAAGSLFAASPTVFGAVAADNADNGMTAIQALFTNDSSAKVDGAFAELDRTISLYNTHTQEVVVSTFYSKGKYVQDALHKLNLFLRDHRENEAMVMDQKLFTQMWAINQMLDSENTFEIISGYRTPKTNEYLRSKGSGVARFSYHMVGQAIDLRLRDMPLKAVRDAAKLLNAGGVGYYESSDFVHIDTGEKRQWG